MKIIFFHRNRNNGFSINKVTKTFASKIKGKEEFYVPCANAKLLSMLKNIIFVFFHRDRNAINHITGDIHYCILGLIGCKSVLTIHDTVGYDFNRSNFLKKLILKWLWYKIPLLLATRIVCISEETKKSVQKFTKRSDIIVINNAVDPKIQYTPKVLNLGNPRILIIGTGVNKNIERTLQALSRFQCTVVIVGKLNDAQKISLKENILCYENKINLTDEEILEEYKKCDIVSFISLYEGFGMPIIEANAIGRPILCSDIPVIKEIANDAALFVKPLDVNEIRNSFKKLFSNPNLCSDLIKKGLANAQKYDVKKIFEQYQNLYGHIGGEK